jgi:hypothetical protein
MILSYKTWKIYLIITVPRAYAGQASQSELRRVRGTRPTLASEGISEQPGFSFLRQRVVPVVHPPV